MEELTATIISLTIAILTAVGSLIISKINTRKMQNELDSIKQAIDDGGGVYYIECPHCGKRIYLQGLQVKVDKEKTKKRER